MITDGHDPHDTRPLTHLLDEIEAAAAREIVSLRGVIDEIGDRSITPFILLIAVLVFGLFTRDGHYLLMGYAMTAITALAILPVLRGWF